MKKTIYYLYTWENGAMICSKGKLGRKIRKQFSKFFGKLVSRKVDFVA